MKKCSISVIIRTKNSSKTIQSCLEHLLQQTMAVQEIIVVDSGSTDNTLAVIRQFDCTIRSYPEGENFNYSKALNIGIALVESKYILNLSSHVILENPKTIEFMLQLLEKKTTISAVSTYIKRKEVEQVTALEDLDKITYNLDNFTGFGMSNPCALFRKKLWEEHPFDENLPAAEEQEWVLFFMKKYNYKSIVIYNPYVIYLNSYFNTYKVCRDMITVGRYIYPPILEFKNVFKLLTWGTLGSLVKGDFQRVIVNYRFFFMLMKEKLGFKLNLDSNYNKKLK